MTSDPPPSAPPPLETAPEDRLDSWKEIATYLKRDVTTVQRWEKREGMPVRRHVHDKLGSVYAFRSELDGWARSRNLSVMRDESEADESRWPGGGVAGSRGRGPLWRSDPATSPPSHSTQSPSHPATPRPSHSATHPLSHPWGLAAVGVLLLSATFFWLHERTEYFWRSPVADAQFQHLTDFDGAEQAAAISRDGRLVAFQSDRDGRMDIWVTQVGTGRFYNLTRGRVQEIVNASVRTIGFSPDGALVTFWARRTDGSGAGTIGVWAVPALGGEPQPYLEGVAEFDWSSDGSRLVFHTPGAGDPTFVRNPGQGSDDRPIFTAPPGLHAHFPFWSQDQAFIYFVQGEVPDAMDIWRISPSGGAAERITYHSSRVTYPVMLNRRTLMYLAAEADGSGPWLYTLDVDRRVPHRVSAGVDSYTSLAVSADGRRLVMTLASPKGTLWRMSLADRPVDESAGAPISLTTGRGTFPRLGPDYLLYVSSRGRSDSIWKLADGKATELWTAPDARIVGSPEIDPDGRRIAFSIEQQGKTLLYVMNADGTDARVVTASLDLRGFPAWAPHGRSITSAANVDGTPHLFSISLDGSVAALVQDYALDPVWARDGEFVVYSGRDIGTTFPVKAVTDKNNTPYALPDLTLTRGARRVRFFAHRRALVVMRGTIHHKDLWLIDLETGAERQLTSLSADFNIRDFDISRDGREIVLEQVEEQSDVVLLDNVDR